MQQFYRVFCSQWWINLIWIQVFSLNSDSLREICSVFLVWIHRNFDRFTSDSLDVGGTFKSSAYLILLIKLHKVTWPQTQTADSFRVCNLNKSVIWVQNLFRSFSFSPSGELQHDVNVSLNRYGCRKLKKKRKKEKEASVRGRGITVEWIAVEAEVTQIPKAGPETPAASLSSDVKTINWTLGRSCSFQPKIPKYWPYNWSRQTKMHSYMFSSKSEPGVGTELVQKPVQSQLNPWNMNTSSCLLNPYLWTSSSQLAQIRVSPQNQSLGITLSRQTAFPDWCLCFTAQLCNADLYHSFIHQSALDQVSSSQDGVN